MQTSPPEFTARRPRFAWRALTSVLIGGSFCALAFSGGVLFLSPPGRVANWTNWAILGLRKHDWIALHIWYGLLFLLVTLVHVFFNWRPLVNYFKDRLTRRIGFRWEWAAALVVCLAVFGGTRAGVPPFSSLLAFNERVKESWDHPRERAPIPHAELLTLAELAEKAGVDMNTASNRLRSGSVTNISPEIVVQQLADLNQRSALQIYQVLLNTSARTSEGHGKGAGSGRGGYGGGAGGGPGRKTLLQYCTDEGLDVKDALARLEAKGIKAAPEQTLREIAVNNGYDRPYQLLDILQGNSEVASRRAVAHFTDSGMNRQVVIIAARLECRE